METIETPNHNGLAEILKDTEPSPRLPDVCTRRLQRLQFELTGASAVAQAAVNAHNTSRDAYERAFMEACEDYGIQIPPGPHDVAIDWRTGGVTFTPKQT